MAPLLISIYETTFVQINRKRDIEIEKERLRDKELEYKGGAGHGGSMAAATPPFRSVDRFSSLT
ncbi:hypothetical protein HanPI659440_Chr09g0335901 [Helianthus annuus]|nr:hypothetical protein HanPI659440_Chr09g0335901 [Helianthus annuus]